MKKIPNTTVIFRRQCCRAGSAALLSAFITVFVATLPAAGQNEGFSILSLSGNGLLTWTNYPPAASYRVEWAPTATGPWSKSWEGLAQIPATGSLYSVAVPMFYRVAAIIPTNTLVIHGDGTNGSLTIRDEAGHAIRRFGDTQVSTAQSKFGGGSIRFDGDWDYLASNMNPDWGFGSGDFTVDMWVNFTAAPTTTHLVGQHTSGVYTEWCMIYQGGLSFLINGLVAVTSPWTPALGTWYHVAATRQAGTLRLFIDGKLKGSAANTANIASGRDLTLASTDNQRLFLNGYLDEIRICKGTAWWTADFAPPEAPYE